MDGRENVYFPADKDLTKVFSLFTDSEDHRLTISEPAFYPRTYVLEQNFSSFVNYEAEGGLEKNVFRKYRLEDADGTEITVHELVQKYLYNPQVCFKKGFVDTDIVNILTNCQEQSPTDTIILSAVKNNLFYASQVLANHLHTGRLIYSLRYHVAPLILLYNYKIVLYNNRRIDSSSPPGIVYPFQYR